VAFRKDKIKQKAEGALRSILTPGEQEVASINVIAGPSPWLAMGALGLIGQLFAKYYYVTVTNQRVLFIGMSRWTTMVKGLAFADPLAQGTVSDVRLKSLWSSFRYRRPDGKVLRLNVHRIWRDEIAPVLKALGASA
jgi:hypothetical protein